MGRLLGASDAVCNLICMGIPFPRPLHMPCSECGAAVERPKQDEHVCEPDRLLDYQLFQLRDEVAALEGELVVYLDSPRGRFELWCAERDRRNGIERRP
jgi:hypothetical protein